MAQRPEIIRLGDRRRLLLARSEQYRRQMTVELDNLRPAASWVERGYSVVQTVRSVWPLVATAAGFFVARKGGPLLGNLGKVWSWWRLGKKLVSLWRGEAAESASPEAES